MTDKLKDILAKPPIEWTSEDRAEIQKAQKDMGRDAVKKLRDDNK